MGAELEGICREAAIAALREDVDAAQLVATRHFAAARAGARPAVTAKMLQQFEAWSAT